MTKSAAHRIAFYVIKVSLHSRQYPRRARRYDRLMAYKAEMHRQIAMNN